METPQYFEKNNALSDRLEELLETNVFDEREVSLIRMRYGIGRSTPLLPSEISKVMKLKAKVLEELIEQVDRKIFNCLKNQL